MTRRSSLAIGLAVILTGLGAMGVALWLTRPLIQLRTTVEALAGGELSRRVGSRRHDEIGDLGRAFDHMADQLQHTLGERTRLADAVERERATLAAVLASMTDGLLVFDRTGRVVYSNDPCGRLLGIDPQKLLGKDSEEWLGALDPWLQDPEATRTAWNDARSRPEEHPTFVLELSGPPRRDLRAQCFPVPDGKLLRTGVLLHDVTVERELVRAKDELTSMVSHELASPATNLVAYAESLASPDVAESERATMLAAMVHEGQRLLRIVHDFLDIKRLEHGRLHITRRPIDLRHLLEHAATVARADAHHPLVLDIPDALPLVEADPNRIQQVLANLVSNAQKYTPSGGVLRLAARPVSEGIEVSVTDHGLGIPAEALPRLFDKFYRVETTDRRAIRGTGLGLAIAKEMVEANGGRIGVESDGPGLGSRFWFTVPLAAEGSSAPMQGAAEGPGEAQPTTRAGTTDRPLRILAVDDDPMVRTSLIRLLRLNGHSVRTADSGEEALDHLGAGEFDVVLSDLGLGNGMDGYELAREVQRAWRHVSFILVSGSVNIDPVEARGHGVDAVLGKPYRPDELRALIAQVAQSTKRVAHQVEAA
jgi:signal transduction histidine kinase/CheY-like chemotaxis protein